MKEKIIKNIFGFLISEYNFKYHYEKFSIYQPMITETYSFYNNTGSFTISELAQRDEMEYIVLDNINLLYDFLQSTYTTNFDTDYYKSKKYFYERNKHYINIFEAEPQIWKKYHIKIFYTKKRELKILSKIIRLQISKYNSFFGIQV